jgi:hypothetical protein
MNAHQLPDIRDEIGAPPRFPEGQLTLLFDQRRFPLVEAIYNVLIANGLAPGPIDLSMSHLVIADEHRLADPVSHDSLVTTLVSKAFCEDTPARRIYRAFIQMVSRDVLGFDVVFQAAPTFRFHFPAKILPSMRGPSGELLAYHFDQTFGDPFQHINCWMPFTKCFGSNAMLVANHADSIALLKEFCSGFDFDRRTLWTGRRRMFELLRDSEGFRTRTVRSCAPLETDYGRLHLFDGRFLHGTAENTEQFTRVSADFRLLSVADYQDMLASGLISGLNAPNAQEDIYLKGRFYDALTASEV